MADVPVHDLVRPDVLGPLLVAATGDERWRHPDASLIAGGKSNLTFRLTGPPGSLVLRRPPAGDLPRSAHDMGREVRVQRALAPTAVPVPRIVLHHDDPAVLGVPFYVMDAVAGHVVRAELPPGYASTPAQRTAVADALVDTLAELHGTDPAAVGLADFGRPDGFLDRQVRRWADQSAVAEPVPQLVELGARLAATVPVSPPATVLHGDFRLDNCLLHTDDPGRVAAVLDWELATVGDPLTDLALVLLYWREPGEWQSVLTPTVSALPGFPPRAHLADRYADATGLDLSGLAFYLALAHLKFAAIAQGIAGRVAAGAMAGQDFGELSEEIVRFAEDGLAVLDEQ